MKNKKCIISYLEEKFYFPQKNKMNYRLSIRNLDNPGWNSFIPISDLYISTDWVSLENSDEDWIFWRIHKGIFEFSCSPLNLVKSFEILFETIETENPKNNSCSLMNELSIWFNNNCNGDWEHSNIVCIEAISGIWKVKIDFDDLVYPYDRFVPHFGTIDKNNWYKYNLEGRIFYGESSPNNLHKLLEGFFENIDRFER